MEEPKASEAKESGEPKREPVIHLDSRAPDPDSFEPIPPTPPLPVGSEFVRFVRAHSHYLTSVPGYTRCWVDDDKQRVHLYSETPEEAEAAARSGDRWSEKWPQKLLDVVDFSKGSPLGNYGFGVLASSDAHS